MSENRGFVSSVSFGRHAYSFGRFRANMPSLHIYICFHTLTGYRAFIGSFTYGCVPKPTKPTKPNEGMRAHGRWSANGGRTGEMPARCIPDKYAPVGPPSPAAGDCRCRGAYSSALCHISIVLHSRRFVALEVRNVKTWTTPAAL